MSTVLRFLNVSKQFRSLTALEDLNLQVQEASVYGFIGPNGAGKTTAIKILMNLVAPTSGQAEILGCHSRHLGPALLERIGYVSENQKMPDWMTVEYLLKYLKPFYPMWDDQRAQELIEQFNLPLDRKLRHLSRGMWMKAAFASSLAYRPKLLVLDEPFSGLDPLVREELIEGLVESAEETTIFISSHDLADIESFASHIGYIDRGRLQFSEEMSSLSARFRQVEVVADSPADVRGPQWPEHWLRPEAAPPLIRFVDTHFDPERTNVEIRRLFGDVQRVSVNAMPLRAIFVTLARNGSKAA